MIAGFSMGSEMSLGCLLARRTHLTASAWVSGLLCPLRPVGLQVFLGFPFAEPGNSLAAAPAAALLILPLKRGLQRHHELPTEELKEGKPGRHANREGREGLGRASSHPFLSPSPLGE